jgi:hypothetical protein
MSSLDKTSQTNLNRFKKLRIAPPFEALLLPIYCFPIPEAEKDAVRQFLSDLTAKVLADMHLSIEIFIQAAQRMPEERGSLSAVTFSKNGREWIPKLGLGGWPDRPPPT